MPRKSALEGWAKIAPGSESSEAGTPVTGSSGEVPPRSRVRQAPIAPSRQGRKALTVHVDEGAHMRLKVLAAQERTTIEALANEAIELLFKARSPK